MKAVQGLETCGCEELLVTPLRRLKTKEPNGLLRCVFQDGTSFHVALFQVGFPHPNESLTSTCSSISILKVAVLSNSMAKL